MNFQLFKTKIEELVYIDDFMIDKDEYLNDLYTDFREMPEYESLEEWIKFWFQENKPGTHLCYLKEKIQTNLSLSSHELIIFHDFLEIEREEYGLSPEQSEVYNKMKCFLIDHNHISK